MKSLLLTFALSALALGASADNKPTGTEWMDMQVNEVNRYPIHTHFFTYESLDKALKGDKTQSANFLSLDGTWKFKYVENADERPTDFYLTDLDDSSWGTMPVPGMWELNGYGDPVYVNIGFAWRGHYKDNPPVPPTKDNHVGSYRRTITVPANWDGKQIIAHFGSVTSNMYLYVNGEYVGYTEDSKVAAEFDITEFVHPGENLFAFQTFRWCDGSYCEDQDFWRLSGVARDSYLYTLDAEQQLTNIHITPDLDAAYKDGSLHIVGNTLGNLDIELSLLDAQGNEVCKKTVSSYDKTNKATSTVLDETLNVADPLKWTAETPNLYTLVAKIYALNEQKVGKGKKAKTEMVRGELLSVVPQKVGFRKVEIKGDRFYINGKTVYIKGADRHEMDPKTGYIVSRERMIEDLTIMKSLNLNAVRTCHYPDDPQWYDLCDEYGIYLVAEANQESHGFGYDDTSEAKKPLFQKQILERNQHNVGVYFNHPSIVFWSMGNETVDGPNFTTVYEWIKAVDPSRPIHWERAQKGANSDVFCPMYSSQEYCQRYVDSNKPEDQKPLIQCEYNHAMGNSSGGFKEYWDIVRQNKRFQGGFIWDFEDQALFGRVPPTMGLPVRTLMYGGDYNKYDASDNNFNCNGFITADRKLTPEAYEVGYQYQSIWTELKDKEKGIISVKNEYFFRDLKNYRLRWEIVQEDGRVCYNGTIDNLDIAPQQTKEFNLNFPEGDADGELLLNVYYELKEAEPLLKAGQQMAHQQFILSDYLYEQAAMYANLDLKAKTKLTFNKETGFIETYTVNGEDMLINGGTLKPNFWRAVTDNDMGASLQKRLGVWRNPQMNLVSLKTKKNVTTAVYDMPEVQATLTLTYTIQKNGALTVNEKMTTTEGADVPRMLRFGMVMELPYRFDQSKFYGLGPIENYVDRCSSQMLGIYSQTADEQFWKYVRPQETGTKTGIRWWQQGPLKFMSNKAFSASALHYTVADLDEGDEKDQRHPEQVRKSEFTNLYIDAEMAGVGGIDSWSWDAEALPKYRVDYKDREFEFTIIPQ